MQYERPTPTWVKWAGAILVLVAFSITLTTLAALAGAQTGPTPPQPAPITDYANYPANSETEPGCDASGVHGVEYAVNGGAPVFDLQDIGPIQAGDVLEVSWTDVADACNTPVAPQPIVLAMKSAPGPVFDPTVDQELDLPYAIDFMGPMGGRITYVLPNLLDDTLAGCFGQIDFIVGLPLRVVGPNGSFYSLALNGEKQMLVDAWNGEYVDCTPAEVTTTTTTTQVEATTTTVEATTTTLNVAPTTSSLVAPPTTVADQIAQRVAAVKADLPVTGLGTTLLWVGAIVLLAGAGLLVWTRYQR